MKRHNGLLYSKILAYLPELFVLISFSYFNYYIEAGINDELVKQNCKCFQCRYLHIFSLKCKIFKGEDFLFILKQDR